MNKNASRYASMSLFGAEKNRANKVMVAYKDPMLSSGLTVSCFELADDTNYKQNDTDINLDSDIVGELFSMHFCKKSSLRNMIEYLEEVERGWDNLMENEDDV